MVLVRDIMSREVLKISESATVAELTSILTRHRITGLPVLDSKGKLVGVVSEFDVIDRRGKTVGDIMSREPITISPDGQLLAYMVLDPAKKNSDVWLMQLATRKATPLLATPFNEGALEFSPDGKWIVYRSEESGRSEIYVQQFPDSTGKWIVSRGGGSMPSWDASGRQIYYLSPERKMMSVPVALGASFDAGSPVALFEAHVRDIPFRQYAVTRDGSKFLLNRSVSEEGTRPMTLIENWSSQLERR
jgi:Tol biopolymer transport system component